MNDNNDNKSFCLFPSISSSSSKAGVDGHNTSSVTLFPSVASSTTTVPIITTLPQCSSFRQNIDLIDKDDDNNPTLVKSSNTVVIDLSSNDDSNSSVEFISKRKKNLKKKGKHKHRRHERKKKPESLSVEREVYDNSYLSYLPKGSKANFIEDIPNLRPEHAFRLDRSGDKNNRAFDKLYERYVPRYHSKHVIRLYHRQESSVDEKKKKDFQNFSIKSNGTRLDSHVNDNKDVDIDDSIIKSSSTLVTLPSTLYFNDEQQMDRMEKMSQIINPVSILQDNSQHHHHNNNDGDDDDDDNNDGSMTLTTTSTKPVNFIDLSNKTTITTSSSLQPDTFYHEHQELYRPMMMKSNVDGLTSVIDVDDDDDDDHQHQIKQQQQQKSMNQNLLKLRSSRVNSADFVGKYSCYHLLNINKKQKVIFCMYQINFIF